MHQIDPCLWISMVEWCQIRMHHILSLGRKKAREERPIGRPENLMQMESLCVILNLQTMVVMTIRILISIAIQKMKRGGHVKEMIQNQCLSGGINENKRNT